MYTEGIQGGTKMAKFSRVDNAQLRQHWDKSSEDQKDHVQPHERRAKGGYGGTVIIGILILAFIAFIVFFF